MELEQHLALWLTRHPVSRRNGAQHPYEILARTRGSAPDLTHGMSTLGVRDPFLSL